MVDLTADSSLFAYFHPPSRKVGLRWDYAIHRNPLPKSPCILAPVAKRRGGAAFHVLIAVKRKAHRSAGFAFTSYLRLTFTSALTSSKTVSAQTPVTTPSMGTETGKYLYLVPRYCLIKEGTGDVKGTAILKKISPVAWQHINFCGRYEFSKMPEAIDMDAIIHQLAQVPI